MSAKSRFPAPLLPVLTPPADRLSTARRSRTSAFCVQSSHRRPSIVIKVPPTPLRLSARNWKRREQQEREAVDLREQQERAERVRRDGEREAQRTEEVRTFSNQRDGCRKYNVEASIS